MKKILSLLLGSVLALCSITSCDDDEKLAMTLSGEWTGQFYCSYEYYVGQEAKPRYAYADESYMRFIPDHLFGSTRGTGYELEVFYSGPIAYMYYEFDWKISGEVISLTYFDHPEMDVEIYDYRLTHTRFKGYFGKNKYTIDMKNANAYDWSPYEEGVYYRENANGHGYKTYMRGNELSSEDDITVVSVARVPKPSTK